MMVDNRKETIMDISNATALASTIVALIAPALIQTLKKTSPKASPRSPPSASAYCSASSPSRPPTASPDYGWGALLAAVVGVAQAVYTLVNQALAGFKDREQ